MTTPINSKSAGICFECQEPYAAKPKKNKKFCSDYCRARNFQLRYKRLYSNTDLDKVPDELRQTTNVAA